MKGRNKDFLDATDYEIGDIITFESGTEDDLEDTLKKTNFKIVGSGNSPLYFSFLRGSSTIGNGSVSGYVLVKPEAFNLDVYTEIYAAVEDAEDELSFTDKYDELIDKAIEQIEMVQNVRCEVRRDEIAEMAQMELDELTGKDEQLIEDLKILLLPKDENDDKNVIMEIRGAAGGEEANIFAANILLDDDEVCSLARQRYTSEQVARMLKVPHELLLIKMKDMNNRGYGFKLSYIPRADFLGS